LVFIADLGLEWLQRTAAHVKGGRQRSVSHCICRPRRAARICALPVLRAPDLRRASEMAQQRLFRLAIRSRQGPAGFKYKTRQRARDFQRRIFALRSERVSGFIDASVVSACVARRI
jgi:hypothetical protein